ncbi:unnamed protein product [Symbiodinium pilosum]|uniref:Uncharacterized protein n=1 Tax=Symbiodinium pilosum TaxID=2952 RepID=A0A812SC93_SYMPI|nr:unnamed protein product [Symbiodinium pilosum]
MGKLRVQDLDVLRAFQREILTDLSRMHTNSLPPILESFAMCYEALQASGQDSTEASIQEERENFIVQITSRMARELRLLRPQDASRVLQAIGRLGLIDPKLLATAAALVPPRLASYTAPEILALLEAYASAGNPDAFMLPCLRRALVPLPRAWEDQLQELDDAQVVQAASAFASLHHPPGLLALLMALPEPAFRRRGQGARRRQAHADASTASAVRQLAPACQLALASLVALHLPDSQTFAAAAAAVMQGAAKEAERHQNGASLMDSLTRSMEGAEDLWRTAAKPSLYTADEIILACIAFPTLGSDLWLEEAAARMNEVSLSLLPGFIRQAAELGEIRSAPLPSLHAVRPKDQAAEKASLLEQAQQLAEESLLARLTGPASARTELRELPPMAVVALFRALELAASKRRILGFQPPKAEEPAKEDPLQAFRRATIPLLQRLEELAQDQELTAKACIRVLQSLKALGQSPPPPLVACLAKALETLSAQELSAALRPLTAQSVKASGERATFSAAATRAMPLLRSSRQAWELEGLCKNLHLDIGEVMPDEDLLKEEVPGEAPAAQH